MDVNNYNYSPHMAEEQGKVFAEYNSPEGYGKITLEQWKSDRSRPDFVVIICNYSGAVDLCENFPADGSRGWDSLRQSFKNAVMLYNQYAPEPVPMF